MIAFKSENIAPALERARGIAGDALLDAGETTEGLFLQIEPGALVRVVERLRDDTALGFAYFIDVTAVDRQKLSDSAGDRFLVVYQLLSPNLGVRLELRTALPDSDPAVDSLSALFAGANWGEREVFDMFGIVFRNHPDLRRILTPDDYTGYPLRKDYPLKGHGERAAFPTYSAAAKPTPGA